MTVTSRVEAVVAVAGNVVGVAPREAVALPPSSLDTPGLIRVDVGGTIITRAYDPDMEP